MDAASDTFSIGELGEKIDRKPHTIRGWERSGRLPVQLRGSRDDRGRRIYTREQVLAIEQWMKDSLPKPGAGLPYAKEDQ